MLGVKNVIYRFNISSHDSELASMSSKGKPLNRNAKLEVFPELIRRLEAQPIIFFQICSIDYTSGGGRRSLLRGSSKVMAEPLC